MDREMTGTAPNVYPTFRYRDADAGLDFLKRAFGFEELNVYRDDSGAISHAELHLGPGIVMFGAESRNAAEGLDVKAGGASVYIAVEDTDALFERASAAGAEIVRGLTDTDYGSREFSAKDPEGNRWSFGTYQPVVPGA
jgi:uncharacterized glyoxalase superfamily protein PhnB